MAADVDASRSAAPKSVRTPEAGRRLPAALVCLPLACVLVALFLTVGAVRDSAVVSASQPRPHAAHHSATGRCPTCTGPPPDINRKQKTAPTVVGPSYLCMTYMVGPLVCAQSASSHGLPTISLACFFGVRTVAHSLTVVTWLGPARTTISPSLIKHMASSAAPLPGVPEHAEMRYARHDIRNLTVGLLKMRMRPPSSTHNASLPLLLPQSSSVGTAVPTRFPPLVRVLSSVVVESVFAERRLSRVARSVARRLALEAVVPRTIPRHPSHETTDTHLER